MRLFNGDILRVTLFGQWLFTASPVTLRLYGLLMHEHGEGKPTLVNQTVTFAAGTRGQILTMNLPMTEGRLECFRVYVEYSPAIKPKEPIGVLAEIMTGNIARRTVISNFVSFSSPASYPDSPVICLGTAPLVELTTGTLENFTGAGEHFLIRVPVLSRAQFTGMMFTIENLTGALSTVTLRAYMPTAQYESASIGLAIGELSNVFVSFQDMVTPYDALVANQRRIAVPYLFRHNEDSVSDTGFISIVTSPANQLTLTNYSLKVGIL